MTEITPKHIREVRYIANSVASRVPPDLRDELFSIGLVGLMEALPRHDPSRSDFTTFAKHRVHGAIVDFLRTAGTVRRPRNHSRYTYVPTDFRMKVFNTPPVAFESTLATELQTILDRAIATLPDRQRLVIELYYIGDLTMVEVGRRINVTEGRASQIHRAALASLKSRLQELVDRRAA